jgi:N-acetylmuramoyl-L-alanine amidase
MIIKHNRHLAVLHVSATKLSRNYTIEDCKKDHLARGFNDIGYHFYIDQKGEVHEGRPLTRDGAHVQGHNKGTIGICCEGGIGENGKPTDTMNGIQKTAVEGLLQALKKGNPNMKVTGHRDLSPDTNGNGKIDSWERLKECPCYDAAERFKFINV